MFCAFCYQPKWSVFSFLSLSQGRNQDICPPQADSSLLRGTPQCNDTNLTVIAKPRRGRGNLKPPVIVRAAKPPVAISCTDICHCETCVGKSWQSLVKPCIRLPRRFAPRNDKQRTCRVGLHPPRNDAGKDAACRVAPRNDTPGCAAPSPQRHKT